MRSPPPGLGGAGSRWMLDERGSALESATATQKSEAGTSLAGSVHSRSRSNSDSSVGSDHHRHQRLRTGMETDASLPRVCRNETAQFLGNVAPAPAGLFDMVGDKTKLLAHPALSEPLLAVVSQPECKQFIDAFTGTMSVPLWLARQGKLPPELVLNELAPYRSISINQSIAHPGKVEEELRRIGGAIRQSCYKALNTSAGSDDVPEATLAEWENRRNTDPKQHFGPGDHKKCHKAVHKMLMREAADNWDEVNNEPKNNATTAALHHVFSGNMYRSGTPVDLHRSDRAGPDMAGMAFDCGNFRLQMLGDYRELQNKQGRIRVTEDIEAMVAAVHHASSTLTGAQVFARDGWSMIDLAQPGDVVFLDPPYLLGEFQEESTATTYLPGSLDEYRLDGLTKLVGKLESAWKRGVFLVMTNRFDHGLRGFLEKQNWRVSKPVYFSSSLTELVAANFDVRDGKPVLREFGKGNPLADIPGAESGRWVSQGCKLDWEEPRELDGIIIDGNFYAVVEGKITRFEPQNTRALRNRAVAVSHDFVSKSVIWEVAADQSLPSAVAPEKAERSRRSTRPESTAERVRRQFGPGSGSSSHAAASASYGRPSSGRTDKRMQEHMRAARGVLEARSALLNKLHELHRNNPDTAFRIDEVTDVIVNDDPRYCHLVGLRIKDFLSLETLKLTPDSSGLATGYFDKLKSLQEMEEDLRSNPYGKATREHMAARLAELTAQRGTTSLQLHERAALAAILEKLGPDGRPHA